MINDLKTIADGADMIIDGYAFTKCDSGYKIIDLNNMKSAMVVNFKDEVIETTMDDIEIGIVMNLYKRNKKFVGERQNA